MQIRWIIEEEEGGGGGTRNPIDKLFACAMCIVACSCRHVVWENTGHVIWGIPVKHLASNLRRRKGRNDAVVKSYISRRSA